MALRIGAIFALVLLAHVLACGAVCVVEPCVARVDSPPCHPQPQPQPQSKTCDEKGPAFDTLALVDLTPEAAEARLDGASRHEAFRAPVRTAATGVPVPVLRI